MSLNFFDSILENPVMPLYGLTVVVAIWRYPKYFDTPLKYFPILLMYTLLNETLGLIIDKNESYNFVLNDFYSNYNVVIYNIYNIVFFIYFYSVFWSYVNRKKHKKFIVISSVLFLLTSMTNPFLQSFMLEAQVYTYVVGAVVLIFCIIFYFQELHSRFDTWFLKRDIISWIGIGMLIYNVCYLPIKITRHYNAVNGLIEAPFVRRLHLLLILIMYACFIIGFLRMRRRKQI